MRRWITPGLLLVALAAALVAIAVPFRYMREQSVVDDCLSKKHSSFDYATISCDVNENHPYVPYGMRHRHDVPVALTALIAFARLITSYPREIGPMFKH